MVVLTSQVYLVYFGKACWRTLVSSVRTKMRVPISYYLNFLLLQIVRKIKPGVVVHTCSPNITNHIANSEPCLKKQNKKWSKN